MPQRRDIGLFMDLRDHPLMSFYGIRSWPPVWSWAYGAKDRQPRGEVGILKDVRLSKIKPAQRCFLDIDHEGSKYIGCLLIEDHKFCDWATRFLHTCLERPIVEIGSLDVSYTL